MRFPFHHHGFHVFVVTSFGLASTAQGVDFTKDVRPILMANCVKCHGPDSIHRKADLRLDQREPAMKSGTIVPGKPDESEFVRRVLSTDEADVMPPPGSHKSLTNEQKEILRNWVAQGADFPPHWSFIVPSRPSLPSVAHAGWVKSPIDQFVLAKLEEAGLEPAPEADRATLARRLSLDLRGIPPTPEEVDAFVSDTSSDAYENYVDRLMATKAWGQHRGRYWLDAARYADTHGIHFDNFREVWVYRDWVINAFNDNMPFDQFTREQLAGDLLPKPTLQQQIASGFNRCNITTNEGGAIDEEYLVLYARDRTETTSTVWLGMTLGCCVCHDHKFDPFSQKDFYRLAAFFNNTTQRAMDGNIKDTPPVIVVPEESDRGRWDALGSLTADTREKLLSREQSCASEFEAWQKEVSIEELAKRLPAEALRWHAKLAEGEGVAKLLNVATGEQTDILGPSRWEAGHTANRALVTPSEGELVSSGSIELRRDEPFTLAFWVRSSANSTGAVVSRMAEVNDYRGWDVWLEGGKIGTHLINKWPDNAIKVVANKSLPLNAWTHVAVVYDGSSKAAGVTVFYNGEKQATSVQQDSLKDTLETDAPFKLGTRNKSAKIPGLMLQDLRVYGAALTEKNCRDLTNHSRAIYLVETSRGSQPEGLQKELVKWWLNTFDAAYLGLTKELGVLEQEQNQIRDRGSKAHVMHERPDAPMAHILFRGDYDKRRDPVAADTPENLPPFPEGAPRNRLGFAEWLLSPQHPLTARVTVNRFWQELFGAGLVRTAGDFGVNGELPSHPELLDWLAVEFREKDWDIKRIFKTIVMSAAYRQSAVATPEKLAKDPSNRLLARGPRFRMDAEMLRDYALASSGLLVDKIGGPSVRPYQPEGVWEAVAMIGSNTRDYVQDKGENLYRRSMYTFWKRSAPPASMEIFNAPARETCTVRRERTNTPLQALVTMNDPQFVESARKLAERAWLVSATAPSGHREEACLADISRRVLARTFTSEESQIVLDTLAGFKAFYTSNPDEATKLLSVGETPRPEEMAPTDLAAWTMVANEILNLDEALNK